MQFIFTGVLNIADALLTGTVLEEYTIIIILAVIGVIGVAGFVFLSKKILRLQVTA